jgi:TolA-binding protein
MLGESPSPVGGAGDHLRCAAMTSTASDQQVSGIPSDQVQSWLDSVQEQIRRVQTRIEYLQAEQARLQEQESLLLELLASASSPVA